MFIALVFELHGELDEVAGVCVVGFGVGVGSGDTQGRSFSVTDGVGRCLPLVSSAITRADRGGSGGGNGTGMASGTASANAAGVTDERPTGSRGKGCETS